MYAVVYCKRYYNWKVLPAIYTTVYGFHHLIPVTKAVGRVLKQSKALGWGGDAGSCSALQRQRDMQFVQRMKSSWMLKMGMSNNANKQKHFRAQVMF
ncbi:hypothetical protein OJAV_G00051320 [Oryzias javanicus]|uniref:Uncharacterized protein n=1 Tax=Oryzias javanicus TaxID=123683 RepID=A0A3S2Q670_ORYJA|nr:hypothetical protein OJAV_G00051320 [Oryzias javanicus]